MVAKAQEAEAASRNIAEDASGGERASEPQTNGIQRRQAERALSSRSDAARIGRSDGIRRRAGRSAGGLCRSLEGDTDERASEHQNGEQAKKQECSCFLRREAFRWYHFWRKHFGGGSAGTKALRHTLRVDLSLKQAGMDLFYNQYGDTGPPLIVLHGLLGAHGNWHTLSRTAFREVAQVYAVDQRNHGRSPHADQIDYPTLADDLRAFIDQHDLAPANLLGHSMGGKTAMRTALSYPDRVDRLIVVDIAPSAYPPHHADLLDALARITPADFDSRDEIDAALAEDIPSTPVRQFLLKNLTYEGDSYTWRMNLDAIRAHYDDLTAAVTADTTFDGPTLFVRGEDSDYIKDADIEVIRMVFPNAELATVEGAGHWVHVDAPEALATLVTDFLTDR